MANIALVREVTKIFNLIKTQLSEKELLALVEIMNLAIKRMDKESGASK